MDDLLREFLAEAGEHLDTVDTELLRFEREPTDREVLRTIFRLVHTIKGTCGFLGLPRLEALAHAAETLMGRMRDGAPATTEAVSAILAAVDRLKHILTELEIIGGEPSGSDADLIRDLERAAGESRGRAAEEPDQVLLRALRPGEVPLSDLERAFRTAPGPDGHAGTATLPRPIEPSDGNVSDRRDLAPAKQASVRVAVDVLEHLMTMVSELVLTRNQLLELARHTADGGPFTVPLQRLSFVTGELQEGIMKTRMQPIGSAWAKLPRILRDLGSELGKQVVLLMEGGSTELDRQVLDVIRDPLTHLVRNSADHGIEGLAARRAAGKPDEGTIRLNAFHDRGTITIEVSDDGGGLDRERIGHRALDMGLATEAELARWTPEQIVELIFHPGFSTSRAVTSVSGRGVGLDVVKTNIGLIGGTVTVASEPGRGTVFTMKIPLTLAIVASVIVRAAGQRFAMPQTSVVELVRVRPGFEHAIERINGAAVLRHRHGLLPVIDLAGLMVSGGAEDAIEDGFVVVVQVGRHLLGVVVEAVLETEEIVVKPLCSLLRSIPLFAGHTILGDGTVVLIIDPNGLARRVGADILARAPERDTVAGRPDEDGDLRSTLLVFRGGDSVLKAMPLSLVGRLEEVDAAEIETVGGRASLQYRGRILPLVAVDAATDLRTTGFQPVIVVADGANAFGLIVSEIIDIVDADLDIAPAPGRPDLVGSAIVRGRATEIVDIAEFLPRAGGRWDVAEQGRRLSTLLLIERNPFFRDLLTPVLKAAGYKVRVASTEREALRSLARGNIDIVVADLDNPEIDGAELVAAIRTETAGREPEIVALLSDPGSRGREDLRDLRLAGIVAKFDRSGLLQSLSSLSRLSRLAA